MKPYQQQFIQLALKCEALKFGQFLLKSGRNSPYFFNAGQFQTGAALAQLGRCYAAAAMDAGLQFDVVFGPAYKGIPLATATAIALASDHQRDVPYCFNRKEAKDHGEGGSLVGAPLAGNVLVVDDVITAGTAMREVLSIIKDAQAKPAAILIGLNRQERGLGQESALTELEHRTGVPVLSIVTLEDILTFLAQDDRWQSTVSAIDAYRQQYGV